MDNFDVFNGDADGLCGLHQLRLAEPRAATLITGVKRDIALLQRVPRVPGAWVTVLDISLDRNRDALAALLEVGAQVEYFDHHYAGAVPEHTGLRAHIDTSADVCTSALVDRHIDGAQRVWAVVGAFGDNMDDLARRLAASLSLPEPTIQALRDLGQCLNYNAYGDTVRDLFVAPVDVYRQMQLHGDPFRFIAQSPALRVIRQGRDADLARAQALDPHVTSDGAQLFLLPDASWSRRVRGAFGNTLARGAPQRAHAVLTPDGHGCLVVSVRAPLQSLRGADALCLRFPTGGGRAAAAGIDRLVQDRLPEFVQAFLQVYGSGPIA